MQAKEETRFVDRRVGRFRLVAVLAVFALLAVAITVVVVLVVKLSPESTSPTVTVESECLDVAVIGGGIGGSYTAWRLRNKGLSVSLFEYSDRIGGRLFTKELPTAPGAYIDLGGMRFSPAFHSILSRTIAELNLTVIPFELGLGNPAETMWYIRRTHLRNVDFGSSKVPYNIDPSEGTSLPSIYRNLFVANVVKGTNSSDNNEQLYSFKTTDGIPLYKMSLNNFLGQYASREVYNYLKDSRAWSFVVGERGISEMAKYLYGFQAVVQGPFLTVDGGMSKVPQTLMKNFIDASKRHHLHLNHQLVSIQKKSRGGYDITFRRTKTDDGITTAMNKEPVKFCARKVVLTMHRNCISALDFPGFVDNPDIMKKLNIVMDYHVGKVFLAYNTSWWKTNNPDITHTKSDLPNKQTYDWLMKGSDKSVILASYHDGDAAAYWRELSNFGTPIPGSLPGVNAVTDVVKDRLEKYLSIIYNVSKEDIPEAIGGGMMLWDRYPFYAGWSYLLPGVKEDELELTRKPSLNDDVFIATDAFAPEGLQSWSEGSLTTVSEIIDKYF